MQCSNEWSSWWQTSSKTGYDATIRHLNQPHSNLCTAQTQCSSSRRLTSVRWVMRLFVYRVRCRSRSVHHNPHIGQVRHRCRHRRLLHYHPAHLCRPLLLTLRLCCCRPLRLLLSNALHRPRARHWLTNNQSFIHPCFHLPPVQLALVHSRLLIDTLLLSPHRRLCQSSSRYVSSLLLVHAHRHRPHLTVRRVCRTITHRRHSHPTIITVLLPFLLQSAVHHPLTRPSTPPPHPPLSPYPYCHLDHPAVVAAREHSVHEQPVRTRERMAVPLHSMRRRTQLRTGVGGV